MSIVRVSQISESLEAYMVVNFSAREINRGMHKLAQTPILIKKYHIIKFVNKTYNNIITCRSLQHAALQCCQ
jgi:hypothetical protein